jgi:hypothetical protein
MGDVANLHKPPIDGELRHEFICDLARFAEGVLTEKWVRRKYHFFDDAAWEKLGDDDQLVEEIENEKLRRIRDGTTARERAQVLYAETPTVLGSILHDDGASPRHRIESAKELRVVAANGPQIAPTKDRFIIHAALPRVGVAYAAFVDPFTENVLALQVALGRVGYGLRRT